MLEVAGVHMLSHFVLLFMYEADGTVDSQSMEAS